MGLDITRLGLRTFVSNPDLEVSLACHVAARLHDKPCGDIQLWLRPYGCRRGAYDEEGADSMNSVSVDSIALAGKQLEFLLRGTVTTPGCPCYFSGSANTMYEFIGWGAQDLSVLVLVRI